MNPIEPLAGIPGTFLYREMIPGIALDDRHALLFHLLSGDVARVANELLPTDRLFETLRALNFLDPPRDAVSKDERLARLCLILTSSCNMRCAYCYNDAGRFKAMMPFRIAQAAIDATLQRPGIDSLLLQFYGGEPGLNHRCLRAAVSYARKVSRVPVLPFVITNGTLDNATLDFLVRNSTRFVISCDLLRTVHDRQRPLRNGRSSFDVIIKNIKRAVDGHRTVTIRSVITNLNVHRMVEMVDVAAGLGVQELILGPCEINVGRARLCLDITRPPLDDYILNYFRAMRQAERHGIHLVDHVHRILQARDPHQSEILFILPDGSITQNTTVLDRLDENAERFITGALDLPTSALVYDQAKREHLQRAVRRNSERFCRQREACALLPICQGRYKAYEFTVEDEPQDLDTYNCEYRRRILSDYVVRLSLTRQGHAIRVAQTGEEIVLFSGHN